ncbi:TadE/TadG family type IV pilus assembly protein [Pararhizobium sp. IMCC21322]|uniref:TadE/TadG family type IV pilus assembly protein n=1 Tax=Pararhizobium sp. IMCC21322 TaxID=3067903 RepID=UPI0027424DDD|nr:TadE family protein [Pararhizobium sp. IMCC21322]
MRRAILPNTRVRRFRTSDDGAAMTEALVALPVLILLTVGVLEFGSLFWQREQIETGLRDAARYMARCRHDTAICETVARNLAYYGSVAALANPRVPDWVPAGSPISFSEATGATQTIVTASTTHQLVNSPLFSILGIDEITITSWHNQRVIGW